MEWWPILSVLVILGAAIMVLPGLYRSFHRNDVLTNPKPKT
jgi:hypothetical protein